MHSLIMQREKRVHFHIGNPSFPNSGITTQVDQHVLV